MSTKILRRADGVVLVERFSPFRRVEHIVVILTFAMLVLTGFPQKFYEATWASWLLQVFGGLDQARFFHRVAGVVFAVHTGAHLLLFVAGVLLHKMRFSMVPVPQDLRDVVATMAWYLGYRKHPPKYPKFDYRQKFEYLGMVLGGFVMIFSGLVLMYPGLLAEFLPGQVIPASRMAHSNEAMLAFLVLIVWHAYGAIFSPEVFPLDRTMVTGFLTAEELEERHGKEYDILFPNGHNPGQPRHGHADEVADAAPVAAPASTEDEPKVG
jgi:formate dehydrogenase gamma subunit